MESNLKLYKERFEPKEYIKTYFFKLDDDFEFFLTNLHRTFQSGILEGKNSRVLLEIGCGPTVTWVISASQWSNHIICSDYGEMNLQEVRRWLERHEEAADWTPFFQYVGKLEDKCHESMLDRVRQSIRDVIYCDVFSSNPVAPRDIKPDVILTSLCLESICSNEEDYQRAVNNMTNILAPDGYLIMQGAMGLSFAWVQGEKTKTLQLNETIIHQTLKNAGMQVVDWKSIERSLSSEKKPTDHDGCFFVVSKKV